MAKLPYYRSGATPPWHNPNAPRPWQNQPTWHNGPTIDAQRSMLARHRAAWWFCVSLFGGLALILAVFIGGFVLMALLDRF